MNKDRKKREEDEEEKWLTEKDCKTDEVFETIAKKCTNKYEYAAKWNYTADKLKILDGSDSWSSGDDARAILNFRYHWKNSWKPTIYNPTWTQWHHIVEQNNIENRNFTAKEIHSEKNMINIAIVDHAIITNHYNWVYFDDTWVRYSHFRDSINTLSFDELYDIWIDVIKDKDLWKYLN